MELHTIHELLSYARQQLISITDSPDLDSQVLLCHILDKPRTWLIAHRDDFLSEHLENKFLYALKRVLSGEPLPYVLGKREFYGLEFAITPDVLIPRPETEHLVELAKTWLNQHPDQRYAIDVGTGSGIIAISLAVCIPDLNIIAADISHAALQIAAKNSAKHRVNKRVWVVQTDLIPRISKPFDLICANLPYIPTGTLLQLPVYSKEPVTALDGGTDGLMVIRRLLQMTSKNLSQTGIILLEIEATLGLDAVKLASELLPGAKLSLEKDLAGHDRVLIIKN